MAIGDVRRKGFGGQTQSTFQSNLPTQREARGELGNLEDILRERFLPQFEEAQGQRRAREQDLQNRLAEGVDYTAALGPLQTETQAIIDQLFGSGGQVEQASSQALRATTETGFGPRSGGFDQARQNILTGARDQVSSQVAQRASELAPLGIREFATETGTLQSEAQAARGKELSLLESLFGGRGTTEQLDLSRDTADLNRQIVEAQLGQLNNQGGGFGGFLGDLFGGVASAATGGLAGGVASGIFGGTEDFVSGLF